MKRPAIFPNILISGDLCPTGEMGWLLKNNKNFIDNKIKKIISRSEIFAVNLEAPLSNACEKPNKIGPLLRSNESITKRIKELGVNTFFLANNHIMDCNDEGLKNTLKVCKKYKIQTLGAGINLERAREPLIKVVNGVKIAFINTAEVEFGAAEINRAGYYGLNVLDCASLIKKVKLKNDIVVLSIHGGLEYFPLPRPGLRETCRFLIEQGADAIVCHHTHVCSAYETYKRRPIFYGLGNFIFDNKWKKPDWEFGYLIKLNINVKHKCIKSFKLILFRQSPKIEGIRLLVNRELQTIKQKIIDLNKVLKDPKKYQTAWNKICIKKEREYLAMMYFPFFYWPISLLVYTPLFHQIVFPLKRALIRLNLLRCASHSEVLLSLHNLAKNKIEKEKIKI